MFYADWAVRPWREPPDHISAAKLEAEQRSSVSRHTPSVMLANLCNVLVFLLDVWGTPRFVDAVYWAIAVLCVAGYIYFGRWRQRSVHRSTAHRIRSARKAIINAFALGCCWAALPLFFFQDAAPGAQLLIACLCAGMLSGGAFALAGIPMAAMAFRDPSP